MRSVESLNAAGRSLQKAEVGRVVGCSWMIVVGRSMSRFLTVRWVNRVCVDVVASPYNESYVGQMLQCQGSP